MYMSIPHIARECFAATQLFFLHKKSAVPADFSYTGEKDSVGYCVASHHAPPRSPSSVCFHESQYNTPPHTKKESVWKTRAQPDDALQPQIRPIITHGVNDMSYMLLQRNCQRGGSLDYFIAVHIGGKSLFRKTPGYRCDVDCG